MVLALEPALSSPTEIAQRSAEEHGLVSQLGRRMGGVCLARQAPIRRTGSSESSPDGVDEVVECVAVIRMAAQSASSISQLC
jgi:hypothetical protein